MGIFTKVENRGYFNLYCGSSLWTKEDNMATYTEVCLAERKNRERIDALIGHDEFFSIVNHEGGSVWAMNTRHDLWLKWNNELWNRLNWMTHLNWCMGQICAGKTDIDVKLNLEDYVYSR